MITFLKFWVTCIGSSVCNGLFALLKLFEQQSCAYYSLFSKVKEQGIYADFLKTGLNCA